MPIRIPNDLPARRTLEQEGVMVMTEATAARQDIRPLQIGLLNLMPNKIKTETQFARLIGATPLQVELTLVRIGNHKAKNTSEDHLIAFYQTWEEVKHRKFDGFIVTGVNALKERVSDEDIWPEVQQILRWTETNVLSSLFLCWGAKAALKHFHDVESIKGKQKLFGLFEHRLISDKTGLLFGFPDVFQVPVSRWKNPRREDILKHEKLEIVADSEEAGPNMMVESAPYDRGRFLYPRRVYILNHPEYDTETLGVEYRRDSAADRTWPLPKHYFPGDDPKRTPPNTWRHTAHIYTNWIKALYEATPYNIEDIPRTV